MKERLRFSIVAASLACVNTPAFAYNDLFAFGDSLSDDGNATIGAYLATGTIVPTSPPYFFAHFSNGPTWVEDLNQNLGLGTLTPSLLGGRDYAVAGAQTGPTAVEPLANSPADLLGQVAYYASTHRSFTPRAGTLYTLDIGGNDIISALSKYGTNVPAVSNVVVAAETNAVDAIEALYGLGARNLLFYEVPDLGLTPRFYNQPLQSYASFYAKWFDETLLGDSRLRPLEQYGGLKVFYLDTYDALDEANHNPAAFGFTDVTDPCWTGNFTSSTSGTLCSSPNSYLFWDLVHPTAKASAETAALPFIPVNPYSVAANFALDTPITVPEPSTWAMTLTGFAGLGWLARLRRRKLTPV
jgi:phospholipase/lecithinase/hemolysin